MKNNNHRKSTVSGLHELAGFLHLYDVSAQLNEYSTVEATYHVLSADQDSARTTFERAAEFMSNYPDPSVPYTRQDRKYEGTVQHSAKLHFGNSTVTYQVLWIEKTGDTEDED